MISCKNLQYSYPTQHNVPPKVLQFPDFTCENDETLLILGRSGRGKTTLLHLIGLILKPQSGTIIIDQQEVQHLSAQELTAVRAAKIGMIYQRPHFVNALSVLDNLLLANYLANKIENKDHAIYLAEQLGFADHLHKKPHQLSLGEQQRVSIARSLVNTPSILLADEPTSSLDDENCAKVIALLKDQSAKIGASLVVVTHDQRLKDEFSNQITL